MKVTVRIINNFRSELKPLIKKYHSLSNDLPEPETELIQNSRLGIFFKYLAFQLLNTISRTSTSPAAQTLYNLFDSDYKSTTGQITRIQNVAFKNVAATE